MKSIFHPTKIPSTAVIFETRTENYTEKLGNLVELIQQKCDTVNKKEKDQEQKIKKYRYSKKKIAYHLAKDLIKLIDKYFSLNQNKLQYYFNNNNNISNKLIIYIFQLYIIYQLILKILYRYFKTLNFN